MGPLPSAAKPGGGSHTAEYHLVAPVPALRLSSPAPALLIVEQSVSGVNNGLILLAGYLTERAPMMCILPALSAAEPACHSKSVFVLITSS